jgi:hypothetical protein
MALLVLGGCSVAPCLRLLALRGGAPHPQLRAVVGYPPVGPVLGPAKWRGAVGPGHPRPWGAKLGQDAINGRGAGERTPARIDRPHRAVRLRPREAVPLHEAGRLTGEGEHTAATVARPYPARAPRSEASPAVEEQQEARRARRRRIGPHRGCRHQSNSRAGERPPGRLRALPPRPAQQSAGAVTERFAVGSPAGLARELDGTHPAAPALSPNPTSLGAPASDRLCPELNRGMPRPRRWWRAG